ncbi:MAG: SGNH/GDSL hydrolase family protein [Eudoraea sp.]|nr:SGNH/GDSL hydrolase family protein [Eudoraea sp.]MBT8323133.1 SGNH/GDSL hydrolase family protein [Eudoraea sp.]
MVISHEQQLLAQDWPQLSHFKTANAQLGAPAKGEQRVVFMGNSITIGWLSHYPEYFEGKPYINRGIGGQTTPQMLLRFRQDVINLKPAVVVILAGTNDIAGNTGPMTLDQIMDNLRSMTQLAKANGIAVVLASVLPAYDYPWRPGLKPHQKIPELNARIAHYARKENIVFLDYFSAMTDGNNGLKKSLGYDGVHPNQKGYEVMAPLTEKAISEAQSLNLGKE